MKGSPCCAGLMRSCLHTYRTKINLTQHIIQPWGGASAKYGGGHQSSMGGVISQVWGARSAKYGGGHQPTIGGVINQLWGEPSAKYVSTRGGSSTNYGGGHQPSIRPFWGGGIFPPVCTGSQNPQNYFSNTNGKMNSCRL